MRMKSTFCWTCPATPSTTACPCLPGGPPLADQLAGWWATTGVKEMDYAIADKTGVPPVARPVCGCVSVDARNPAVLYPRPLMRPRWHRHRLCARGISPASFHRLSKLSSDTCARAQVLAALPTARLHVQTQGLQDAALRQQVAQRFAAWPAAGAHYLQRPCAARAIPGRLRPGGCGAGHLPYTGGTTTCEALWMGVPTLTLAGRRRPAFRQGASLMRAAARMDCHPQDEFVRKASALAADLPRSGGPAAVPGCASGCWPRRCWMPAALRARF